MFPSSVKNLKNGIETIIFDMDEKPLVSVIIPIHNGENWINDCFEAILKQDILQNEKIQLSVYNDASTDGTGTLLNDWKNKISNIKNLSIVVSEGKNAPQGVGFAKNQAIKQSLGEYLCFQDIDDVMLPRRISAQLEEAKKYPDGIIGCQIKRIPENSTPRFVAWANNLPQNLLTVQIYTSHGPTVLMPTWFFHKGVYEKTGKFSEEGKGMSEDLLFFYSHLNVGGTVRRVDEILLIYRYHPDCTTFSVAEETIWNIRLNHLEQWVLPKWAAFTIWNAGKQGRRFYRSLKPSNRAKRSNNNSSPKWWLSLLTIEDMPGGWKIANQTVPLLIEDLGSVRTTAKLISQPLCFQILFSHSLKSRAAELLEEELSKNR